MTEWSKFSSHQKLGLAVLVVIGLATATLGYARIMKNIALPSVRKEGFVFKTTEELAFEREQRLKTLDTDGDALNDYDELYVFRTSPFLEDSDSDGTSDGQEVAANSDPNCPKGKTCGQARLSGSTGTDAVVPVPPAQPAAGTAAQPSNAANEAQLLQVINETFGDPATLTPETIKARLGAMSSAELRAFLVKMGIPEKALQKADDATLRKLLQESLAEISTASRQPAPSAPSPAPAVP